MSDFDPSPRSSKRRKIETYGSNRSTATSPGLNPPSVLRSLSNVVSGISRRLFEPQTENATVAPTLDSAHGSDERSLDKDYDLQNASEAHGEQENGEVYHAAAGTNRSARNNAEAARPAGVVTAPTRRSIRANQSAKGSEGVDGPQEKPSARKSRTGEETISPLAKVPRNNIRTNSSSKRRSIRVPDAENETEKKKVIGSRQSGEGPVTLPKQSKPSNANATSLKVREEAAGEIEAEELHDNITVSQRSSGREKRKPRRYSEVVEHMAEQLRKQPIGILTPSKRDRAGVRKSVVFADEEQQLEEQVSFRDIRMRAQAPDNTKRKNRARKSLPTIATESESLTITPSAAPADRGGGSEEEQQLIAEDTALPDVRPLLNSSSNTLPVLDLLPGADEDSYLTAIKSKVISRLTNSSLVPLTNLTTEYAKVHSLLKATITAGEGNSILILGARGSGKTNLIETALANVTHEHTEDFHIVRLSGFQQTDDKIALREIWRQLGREMQVDECEINQVSSYADTMASLLHLLSHPEELAEVLDSGAPVTTTKSVIFVLDEFDLFAAHPRQTLLYNLFDIAQAKKAPIAVIGCSTRVDVAELLEKRVKSRFSHRWLHLSLPKSFQAFEAVVKAALCLVVDEDEVLDGQERNWRNAWNEYMMVCLPYIGTSYILTKISLLSSHLNQSKHFFARHSTPRSPSRPLSPRYTFPSQALPLWTILQKRQLL
jgi:energy-coupling factor transporter ATP-binding protein EcfA2